MRNVWGFLIAGKWELETVKRRDFDSFEDYRDALKYCAMEADSLSVQRDSWDTDVQVRSAIRQMREDMEWKGNIVRYRRGYKVFRRARGPRRLHDGTRQMYQIKELMRNG